MTIKPLAKSMSTIVFSALLLSACGGGGDSNSSSPAPVEPTAPITSDPITSDPITSTPDDKGETPVDDKPVDITTPPDNNAQAALSANNIISMARTSCGLKGLSVDTALDKIAINHANYIKHVYANSNPIGFNSHVEKKINSIANITGTSNPFFSGVNFTDRLRNANYPNANFGVTENIAQTIYFNSAGNIVSPNVATTSMTKSLLAAPYHLRSLMRPSSSVIGTSVAAYKPNGQNPANNQGYVLVTHGSATQATKDRTAEGLFTYPCQDVAGTVTALYNESPDPFRNPNGGTTRDLRTNPIGQPIYVSMPSADKIKISNIKFRDTRRAQDVPVQLLDFDKDPYKSTNYELPENEAFILPLTDALKSCEIERNANQSQQCGLYGNTKYQVSFDILVDGKTSKTESFSFTTGNVNY